MGKLICFKSRKIETELDNRNTIIQFSNSFARLKSVFHHDADNILVKVLEVQTFLILYNLDLLQFKELL